MRRNSQNLDSIADTTRRALAERAQMIDSLPGGDLKINEEKQQRAWWDTPLQHRLDADISFEMDLWLGHPQLEQAGCEMCCLLS